MKVAYTYGLLAFQVGLQGFRSFGFIHEPYKAPAASLLRDFAIAAGACAANVAIDQIFVALMRAAACRGLHNYQYQISLFAVPSPISIKRS